MSKLTLYTNIVIYSICLLLFPSLLSAQADEQGWHWKAVKPKLELQPVIGLQVWSSYTMGAQVFNEELNAYEAVDNRINFQIRRSRLGVKGKITPGLTFNFTTAIDLVGRDLLAGTEAGSNNGASPRLRLWNAYLQWQPIAGNKQLHIVSGYLLPQIGRESITSALRSNSLEKSWSQNYLRRHLTGIGPGRSMGVNLGGLFVEGNRTVNAAYHIGIFNPAFRDLGNNSVGSSFSPLFVGRFELFVGDPENRTYKLSRKINYFGKRKGLTLSASGAYQGNTTLFNNNTALSFDVLLNLNKLNIDGEWSLISREGKIGENGSAQKLSASASTGYIRAGYNLKLQQGLVLEPVAMFVFLNGATDAAEQEQASQLQSFAGIEHIYEAGVNLYFNPNLKLSLHYTHRYGDAGEAGPGATFNNYFFQSGVGAIQRGNWIGLGVVAIY
jgi:hypothetical protein